MTDGPRGYPAARSVLRKRECTDENGSSTSAKAVAACLRINPGNIGSAERVREVIKAAKDHNCSMRIGVNAGSLERDLLEKYGEPCPEAMVESALSHARILEA